MKLVKPAPSWTSVQIAAIASTAGNGDHAAETSGWWQRMRDAFAPAATRSVPDVRQCAAPVVAQPASQTGRIYQFPQRGDGSVS
jgi:hypothetical protein